LTLLRPLITGPILYTSVAAAIFETVVLTANLLQISGPVFLLTIGVGICACFAHLLACNRKIVIEEVHALVSGRLDAYEANSLNTLIDTNRSHTSAGCDYPRNVYRIHSN
jgi:uncharacterized membrane protein